MLTFFCYFCLHSLLSGSCVHARTPLIYTLNPKNSPNSTNQNYTRRESFRFANTGRENMVHGILKLKKYFNHFGYIEAEDITNLSELSNANLEVSIINNQGKLGLPVTEKPKKTLHGTQKYVYFTGQPRWNRNIPIVLTYAFSSNNLITSLSIEELKSAFQRAFGHWASVIPVTFMESDDYGFADIKIGFYYGDHGDGEAFDGVLGVLAHAFSPESGRFHLDAAETWAVDFDEEKSDSAVDLESVATHEIGHLLGLAHTDVKEAVMFPSLKPRERKVNLKLDDIKGIQALYGSNPNFSLQGFSESEMSSNDAGVWRTGAEFISFNWLLVLLILWLS